MRATGFLRLRAYEAPRKEGVEDGHGFGNTRKSRGASVLTEGNDLRLVVNHGNE